VAASHYLSRVPETGALAECYVLCPLVDVPGVASVRRSRLSCAEPDCILMQQNTHILTYYNTTGMQGTGLFLNSDEFLYTT
jgi:hypothetical protein